MSLVDRGAMIIGSESVYMLKHYLEMGEVFNGKQIPYPEVSSIFHTFTENPTRSKCK